MGAAGADRADRAQGADPRERAQQIALRSLATGPRTRAQLEATLARKGVAPEVAAQVLDRLEEVALVDDAAYARGYVRSRHEGKGVSRRAMAHELRGKGVDDQLAGEALATIDDHDEEERARALVDARLRATRGMEVDKRTRRLVGLLARKGYPPGLAIRVVREQLALEPDIDPADRRFLDGLDGPLSDLARTGD